MQQFFAFQPANKIIQNRKISFIMKIRNWQNLLNWITPDYKKMLESDIATYCLYYLPRF